MNSQYESHVKISVCMDLGVLFWERSLLSQRLSYRHVVDYILDGLLGSFGSAITSQAHKL